MATYEQKKQRILHLFKTGIQLAQRLKLSEYIPPLQEAMQNLDDGRFMVVVCGEFRRGKSSLLNAFLNELQDLFPVDIAITTNLVTTITYGASEKITALVGPPEAEEEDLKKISIKRQEIRLYVTEKDNPQNKREARLIEIALPNPQLKQGLILVDTPGVGGLYGRHTDVTYNYIPRADAIMYVSDAFKPLSAEDLRFIKERILKHTDHILFVLTKKDNVADYDKVMDNNREKLAATLGRPAQSITIIPVSSVLKRTYLKTHDREDLDDSNFPTLENALWQFVNAGRGRILLARTLTILAQNVGHMRRPFQTEYDGYVVKDQQKRDEIEAALVKTHETLQQLLNDNAQWQMQLEDGLSDIHQEVQTKLNQGFSEIRGHAGSYITDDVLRTPELVLGPVQREINDLLHILQRLIDIQTSGLQGEIENVTGLALNPFTSESLYERTEQLSGRFTKREITTWEATVSTASSGSGGGGGWWGAVKGFASRVGRALGFGSSGSERQTMREIHTPDRGHIENQLMAILADNHRKQNDILANTMRQQEKVMRDDLLAKINRERVSRERALRSFQEARTMNATQAQARLALLQGPLQQFDALQKAIQELLEEDTVPGQDEQPESKAEEQTSSTESAQGEDVSSPKATAEEQTPPAAASEGVDSEGEARE